MKGINLFPFLKRFEKLNFFLVIFYCIACNNQQERIQNLETQNDSLQKEVKMLSKTNQELLLNELISDRDLHWWFEFTHYDTLQILNEWLHSKEENNQRKFIDYFLTFPYDTLELSGQKNPLSLRDSSFVAFSFYDFYPLLYFPNAIAWYAARIHPNPPPASNVLLWNNQTAQYLPNHQNAHQQITHYFIYQFDRSSENLQKLFKEYEFVIYELVDKKIYQQLGLEEVIDDLLFSYRYLKENDMDKIFHNLNKMSSSGRHFFWYENQFPISNQEPKEGEIAEIVGKPKHLYLKQWRYSFWYRRYLEGNIEVVYSILLKVKKHYDNQ